GLAARAGGGGWPDGGDGRHSQLIAGRGGDGRGDGRRGSGADLGAALVEPVIGALNSAGGHAYPGQTIQDATVGMLLPYGDQAYEVANCLTQRMHKGINTTADEG